MNERVFYPVTGTDYYSDLDGNTMLKEFYIAGVESGMNWRVDYSNQLTNGQVKRYKQLSSTLAA